MQLATEFGEFGLRLRLAVRGEADVLCTHDGDFFEPMAISYCALRGIEVCNEFALIERLGSDS